MAGLKANEVSKLQGFIEVEIVNPETGISRVVRQNTVTKVGKKAMLHRAANRMLMGFTGVPYGMGSVVDLLGDVAKSQTISNSGAMRYSLQDIGLNNYLVNLPEDVTLDADSKFLPIYDSDFEIDPTKMIGFANSRNQTADSREGVIDYAKGVYMVDDECVAQRWKYPEGVATGTFNHIVMAPGLHGPVRCNGMYYKKCITRINNFEEIAEWGNCFVIPNVPGLTGPNEILLNFNSGGVSRWRYNLSTGETTPVEAGDIALTFPMYESYQQIYSDGFLYILRNSDNRICKINVNTGSFANNLVQMNSVTAGASMYLDGDNIIAFGADNRPDGSFDGDARVYTINKNTMASSYVRAVDYTGWGGFPSGWAKSRTSVTKVDNKFYVRDKFQVIVCTDIMNIKGSVVGAFMSSPWTNICHNGTDVWFIEWGERPLSYWHVENSMDSRSIRDLTQEDVTREVMRNDTLRGYRNHNQGIWISKEWYSNILSFAKLATPITKGPTDIMYVSYGYKFI